MTQRSVHAGREVQVDEKLPEGLRQMIQGITHPTNLPFVSELWVFNPVARLAEVKVPVLIIIGKKDIQVDWQVDGALFEEVAKENGQIRVVFMENTNHVMKSEAKPRSELTPEWVMTSYSSEDVPLDPGTVETISSWLKAHL
jgi:esterase/lipase